MTARLIEAEQALPDFPQLVKELIDNSVDAKATEIILRLSPDLSVNIWDNGHGIEDLAKAIQPHTTSKLLDVSQVLEGKVSSIGFRGEALAAIVALSESVELISKCQLDLPTNYLRTVEGEISESGERNGKFAQTFTEISVHRPFYKHLVRLNNAEKNRMKQIREILHLIYEVAIIHAQTLSITVIKNSADQIPSVLFESVGCFNVRDVICRISNLSVEEFESNHRSFEISEETHGFSARGFLSNPLDGKSYTQKLGYSASQKLEGGHFGRSGGKFVFASINNRPINVPTLVQRRLDSVYRRYTSKNCGGLILFIETSREYDLNMSISKRVVMIPFERYLAMAIEEEAEKLLKPTVVASVKSETLSLKSEDDRESLIGQSIEAVLEAIPEHENSSEIFVSQDLVKEPPPKTPSAVVRVLTFSQNDSQRTGETLKRRRLSIDGEEGGGGGGGGRNSQQQFLCLTQAPVGMTPKSEMLCLKDENNFEGIINPSPQVSPDSQVESADEEEFVVEWSLEKISERLKGGLGCRMRQGGGSEDSGLLKRLKVLGSYRKSFIVCHDGVQSLYLVDQHAADEKFWFEKFNCETQISCQPLLVPIRLKLSTERLLILESLDEARVLERNGYKIKAESIDGERCVQITHMPTIKGLVLNENDLLQLLQMIDNDNGQFPEGDSDMNAQIWNFQRVGGLPRPPRVWNIIAMKSCKTAVKFGQKLSFSRMETILSQMSDLKHPWNCPHGRPTIKKLN